MSRFKPAAILFLVMAFIQSAVVMVYPIDYSYQNISFIPHFSFLVLLLFCRGLSWQNRLLAGGAAGLVIDLFFNQTFPFNTLLYAALALAEIFFYRWDRNRRVLFFAVLFFMFLLDFIPYAAIFLLDASAPAVHQWFLYMELATLLGNGAVLIFLMVLWQQLSLAWDRRMRIRVQNSIHMS